MIQENINEVRQRISRACLASGREENEAQLIAVSKTKPVEMIREAYDLGIRDFGENKVQELLKKKEELPGDIRWHMIGHLQTNKVRQIVGNAWMIHSVDSIKLGDAIDNESGKKGVVTRGLLEVNVGREPSKYGFLDIDGDILERLEKYRFLKICGLMTVAPDVDDPEKNRDIFRQLKTLSVDIAGKNVHNVSMDFLSMGMTGDYEVAVEEGSDFVRVGTGIFGPRNYGRLEN